MPNPKPHILLVNTSADDRTELTRLLKQLPARVTEVASGLAAIEALRSVWVDLVVTDIEIGSFDCWRLTRIIRSGIYQADRTLPIIIVTRNWCERITEITARDFDINHLLSFEAREQLPDLAAATLASPTHGLEQPRVLVVEDNADNARLVSKIFKYQFDVETASDGLQGLEFWKKRRHDLVLLDVMLPGMSGEQVLAEIMRIDPEQPIVVMTAHGTMDLAEKMMLGGAVDYIGKPFRPEQLRKVCGLAARREDYLVSQAQFSARLSDLQQLQQLLGNIIDSMPSVLIGVDQRGRITQWNREAEKSTGRSSAEAIGQQLEDICADLVDSETVYRSMQEGQVKSRSKLPQQRAGKLLYADQTIYPLIEDGVVGAVIRIDDVTQRTMLEGRIVQSEKMASMGELVAGMAHEINNPLAGVLQNAQVVRQRLDRLSAKNQTVAESVGISMAALSDYIDQRGIFSRLDAIMDSGGRAAQLIENMLRFSQHGDASFHSSNLAHLIDRSVELAASHFSLKRKFDFRLIQIERDYPEFQPQVDCDAGQIQQVLLNLLLNGAQAMEEKYKRQVNAADAYLPRFVLRLSFTGESALIDIEDNGPGMERRVQERIFEPFFTTKEIGEGAGLGLSISYFIVTKNHKGQMNVESSQEGGSKFRVSLPLKSAAPT